VYCAADNAECCFFYRCLNAGPRAEKLRDTWSNDTPSVASALEGAITLMWGDRVDIEKR